MASTTHALPHWDLTDLYPSPTSERFKNDLAKMMAMAKRFEKRYEGKIIALTPDEFAKSMAEYEKLIDLEWKICGYVYILNSTNLDNKKIGTIYQSVSEQAMEASGKICFYEEEITQLTPRQLAKKMKSPKIDRYKPFIDELKPPLEKQLSKLMLDKELTGAEAWVRLYDQTVQKVRFVVDGKEIGSEEALNMIGIEKNAAKRAKIGKLYNQELGKHTDTFAFILNTLAKDIELNDKWYENTYLMEQINTTNRVEPEVVNAMIATVKRNYGAIAQRFYNMQASWLGIKKMGYWDKAAPLPFDNGKKYTWEEAKEIVLKVYTDFSPKMGAIAQKFFDNNWIDVGVRKGKQGGAYAHPISPSAHPYLLINFQGDIDDIMKLAHEMGHGIHQYLSRGQGVLLAQPPTAISEVASIFGEMITFKYLMAHETDPVKRTALLAEKTGSMISTVMRQIAFHDFENMVHTERREKGELSPERISQIFLKTQQKMFGDTVAVTPQDAGNIWGDIPHFFRMPFYVHSYAFAECVVDSLYRIYEEGNITDFKKKYIDLLSKGGSEHHSKLFEPFGLDLSDPAFWKGGMRMMKDFVNELEISTAELGLSKRKVGTHKAKTISASLKNDENTKG